MVSLLPKVLVVHGPDSAASPLQIASAGAGLCELAFLVQAGVPEPTRALLQELGTVIEAQGSSPQDCLDRVRRWGPIGITCFGEDSLELTAELAGQLRLPGNSPETIRGVLHKGRQRLALERAGLGQVPHQLLRPGARDDIKVSLPAVLKPVRGKGSRHTYRITALADLEAVLAGWPSGEPVPEMILESELISDPGLVPPGWGDYVSVEGYVVAGRAVSLGVTGKVPLATPFRERGGVYPAPVPPPMERELLAVAARAVEALGLTTGLTHTELKLTAPVPSVIEVNARLGGLQEDLILRATGQSLIRIGLVLACGLEPAPWKGATTGVSWWYAILPDQNDTAARFEAYPDVVSVETRDVVQTDWRLGWGQYRALIRGASASAAEVLEQLQVGSRSPQGA